MSGWYASSVIKYFLFNNKSGVSRTLLFLPDCLDPLFLSLSFNTYKISTFLSNVIGLCIIVCSRFIWTVDKFTYICVISSKTNFNHFTYVKFIVLLTQLFYWCLLQQFIDYFNIIHLMTVLVGLHDIIYQCL